MQFSLKYPENKLAFLIASAYSINLSQKKIFEFFFLIERSFLYISIAKQLYFSLKYQPSNCSFLM